MTYDMKDSGREAIKLLRAPRMHLYTFAHKGEALPFIRKRKFSNIPFSLNGLHQNPDQDLLLITGEGLQRTTERLSAVCGVYAPHIKKIFNVGVAGILDKTSSLNLMDIVSIRTAYHEPWNEKHG